MSGEVLQMPFELRDHTADVAVAATGDDLAGVFAAVADGLAAAMCEEIPDSDGDGNVERFSLSVAAESREALLYDYLAELIYERDVRIVLPVDNEATIRRPTTVDQSEPAASERIEAGPIESESTDDGSTNGGSAADRWLLDASARGVALSSIDAREVKAVTYSEMALERTPDGWHAYVVFDV